MLVACELVSAISRLRDIPEDAGHAEESQGRQAATDMRRTRSRRRDGSRPTCPVGDLEVELSFGVEAYVDTLHVPEIVLQSCRESLTAAARSRRGRRRADSDDLEGGQARVEARRNELAAREPPRRGRAPGIREVTLTYVTVAAVPLWHLAVKANFHSASSVPASGSAPSSSWVRSAGWFEACGSGSDR